MDDICQQLIAGDTNITGVMIESHINAGRQDVPAEGPGALKYGISITDACVDWDTTVGMLDRLNEVRPCNGVNCPCDSDAITHRLLVSEELFSSSKVSKGLQVSNAQLHHLLDQIFIFFHPCIIPL